MAAEEPARPETVPASWTFSPYEESEGEPAAWVEPLAEAEGRVLGSCAVPRIVSELDRIEERLDVLIGATWDVARGGR